MAGSKRIGILYLVLIILFLSECKNHEAVSTNSFQADLSPCAELAQNTPEDALLFAAGAESKREKVAAKKAEKETLIQLVQFFQSAFIEGNQLNLFQSSGSLGNQGTTSYQQRDQNENLRKTWAETSYEMIGTQHNQNAFTHRQKTVKDSTGSFIAYDMLVVPDDWVRNHWQKSLAATDSSFYQNVSESKYHQEVMEMDISQRPPCKNF